MSREIDALIAEHIFDWRWFKDPDNFKPPVLENEFFDTNIRHFSTDIKAAWEVVEKLKKQSSKDISIIMHLVIGDNEKVGHYMFEIETWCMQSANRIDLIASPWVETAPMAICKAALKAREIEAPDE